MTINIRLGERFKSYRLSVFMKVTFRGEINHPVPFQHLVGAKAVDGSDFFYRLQVKFGDFFFSDRFM